MSGLVSGLQNRVRRFESARYLKKSLNDEALFFVPVVGRVDGPTVFKRAKWKACASERKPSLLELLQRAQPSFKPTQWG